jgi:hypothetical protein
MDSIYTDEVRKAPHKIWVACKADTPDSFALLAAHRLATLVWLDELHVVAILRPGGASELSGFIADSSPSATVGDESNPWESGRKGAPISGRRAARAIDLGPRAAFASSTGSAARPHPADARSRGPLLRLWATIVGTRERTPP